MLDGQHDHPGLVTRLEFEAAIAQLQAQLDAQRPPDPTPLPATTILRDTQFQPGQWYDADPPLLDGDLALVEDPAGGGRRVCRYHSRGRAEHHYDDHADDLSLVYGYGRDMLVPRGAFLRPGSWRIIEQLYENGTIGIKAGSPPWSLQLDEAAAVLKFMRKTAAGRFDVMWSIALADVFDRWFSWVMLVQYSRGSDGRLAAWFDGQQVVEWQGPTLIAEDARRPYSKGGCYEGGTGETVVYCRHHKSFTAARWDQRLARFALEAA